MYVILGATGNTGRGIAEALLARGEPVRVVGRSAGRMKPLVEKGAEAFVGSVDNPSALARAFQGAKAVYAMVPPNYTAENPRADQNKIGDALARALAEAHVTHVVNLSSLGAHVSDGAGPISGLHDVEQRLNMLNNTHIFHLRPAYFMENFLLNIPLIKGQGINGSPMRPDIPMPMIATQDIATEAVRLLLDLGFSGKTTRELMGPRDLSMVEATRIIGSAIGKPDLPYVQFPYEQAEKAMAGMGLSAGMAQAMTEMYRGFNEGAIRSAEGRSTRNTTATSLEEFAKRFAAAYAA